MDRHQELRLIRRAKRGDRDAMATLVVAHRPGLCRYLSRLTREEALAEDIAQDAFVRVLRHLDRFDERFRFSTWIYTIGRRLWINHLEKRRPIPDTDRLDASVAETAGTLDVEEAESRRLMRAMVDDAMGDLQPRQMEVVDLFYRRNLSVAEIATRLSLPVGTIKSHLFRGRSRMAKSLRARTAFDQVAAELELQLGARS